jgi:hypothetical protein
MLRRFQLGRQLSLGETLWMLNDEEQKRLTFACRGIPLTSNVYLATDLVSTVLDTVIDYQQHTTTVRNAIHHFQVTRWDDVRTLDDLESLFGRYSNDKEGNIELATYLWGYKFWTRAEQLRGLVAFVRRLGVESLEDLRSWAESSSFLDFEGQIKGLGPVVYQWLTMRLGVETVKPDVHIIRFVSTTLGRPVTEREAIGGLVQAARVMGIKANLLDWSVWEAQRSSR